MFVSTEIVRAMTYVINQGMSMYWGTSRWTAMEIMVNNRFLNLSCHERLHYFSRTKCITCMSGKNCWSLTLFRLEFRSKPCVCWNNNLSSPSVYWPHHIFLALWLKSVLLYNCSVAQSKLAQTEMLQLSPDIINSWAINVGLIRFFTKRAHTDDL